MCTRLELRTMSDRRLIRSAQETMWKIFQTYKNESWYKGIIEYVYEKYRELANRIRRTYQYVTPDPMNNRYTYSPEFANIIRETGTIFESTIRNLIIQSGNSSRFDLKIHGFLTFLKTFDPYLEKRPVLFTEGGIHKYIFPFERSKMDDPSPKWWIAYTNLKHNEIEAYRKGNLENALTSVAALAILSGMIRPRGGAIIFANVGLLDVNMERLFP